MHLQQEIYQIKIMADVSQAILKDFQLQCIQNKKSTSTSKIETHG